MASLFGNISEFNPDREDWIQYSERLEHYFVANQFENDSRKRAIFLMVIGPTAFRLLRSLVAPAKLQDKTLKELVDKLKEHYCPQPSAIVQRLKFFTRVQQPGEYVATYVSQLRSLAEYCNFQAVLNDMLRDRLVCGIRDTQIQRRLLSKRDLTFETALQEALAQEAAAKNALVLQETGASVGEVTVDDGAEKEAVHRVDKRDARRPPSAWQSQFSNDGGPCYRCGQLGHSAARCRFRTAKCHQCGKTGHIRTVCRSKPKDQQRQQRDVKMLQEDLAADSSPEEYTLFAVTDGRKPIEVDLELDGLHHRMEVDTGAALSLVSETTFKRLWPSQSLQPATTRLKTYSGEPLQVLGRVQVRVRYANHSSELPLLVIQSDGPSLFGRNWLEHITLDWQKIHSLNDSPAEEVLRRHSAVFRDELGMLRDHKVKLHVESSVRPCFCKARPVPYAMRALVDKELEKLEEQGVIEPVQFADWAAPIVLVLKADKQSVKICGDFKLTVNTASRLDAYPIPRVEDLFTTMAGGKSFTKLDLRQAYLQLELHEDSKQLVVINTQKGLFKYNRLPFGVSSYHLVYLLPQVFSSESWRAC